MRSPPTRPHSSSSGPQLAPHSWRLPSADDSEQRETGIPKCAVPPSASMWRAAVAAASLITEVKQVQGGEDKV